MLQRKPASFAMMAGALFVIASGASASEWKYRITEKDTQGIGIYRTYDETADNGILLLMATNLHSSHTAGILDGGGMIFWKARGTSGWEYDAERQGDKLVVRSKTGGCWSTNEMTIDHDIWSECLPYTAAKFLGDGRKTFQIWSIDPDDGKLRKIRVDRLGLTNLVVNGVTNVALGAQFTVMGRREAPYPGKYYFHPSDGTLLYVEMDGMKQELLEEK
jgi:hypothetical protein